MPESNTNTNTTLLKKSLVIGAKTWWTIPIYQINICLNSLMPCIWESVELFSWKTTFYKGHSEVSLSYIRLLPGLLGMWPSMKITLFQILLFCKSLLVWFVIEIKVVSMILWLFLFIEVCLFLVGKNWIFIFFICVSVWFTYGNNIPLWCRIFCFSLCCANSSG